MANNAPIPYFYYLCPKEDCECENSACFPPIPAYFLAFWMSVKSGVGVDSIVSIGCSCLLLVVLCRLLSADWRLSGRGSQRDVVYLG